MVVGARWAGLSISQSAQLLGFSRTNIFRVYKEWCEKGKTSSNRQSYGQKCLVDARGQRRMGRLIQADRRATLTEISTRYNRGMQQSICEATTRTTLRWMGYNIRRPHRVPLISTTNRKKRLQFARAHQKEATICKSPPKPTFNCLSWILSSSIQLRQLKTGKMLPGLMSLEFC